MICQFEQTGIALTQCPGRRLECLNDFRYFAVLSWLELYGQVALRQLRQRFLQVGY